VKEEIGLIGIGLVGSALAEHLLVAGYAVVGHDIDPARQAALHDLGGEPEAGAAAVGARCRRVFLSLMTTETVCRVVEGAGGLLDADPPPRYIIDTTTGTPDPTVALAERLRSRGVEFLDAPISGSSRQIRDREAVFMIGGDAAAVEACHDLFRAVSDRFIHVGPSGGGSKAKLASNLVLGLNRMVLAEGLVFAGRLGLDLAGFLDLLKMSPAYSVAMDVKGAKMLAGDFSPQSRVAQHLKDLSIIAELAARAGQPLPLTRVHMEILEKLVGRGDGDLDNSAVIAELRRLGGDRSKG
jgi:3-hydroxyisobutyrate dehydrogenase-like beta-hydroxyacid dehydrogenase